MTESEFDGEAEPMRLLYYSVVPTSCSRDDLKSILASSRKYNAINSVTGVLCLDNRFFFQVLEGSRRSINHILGRVMHDPRTTDVNIVLAEPLAEPAFRAWAMAFVGADSLSRRVCERYCGDSVFRPDRMSSRSARAFALDILASLVSGKKA